MSAANRVCPRCDGDGLVPSYRVLGFESELEDCATCGGRGYLDPPAGTVTLSDIATTPDTRDQLRRQARGRALRALTPRGQHDLLHKQRRRGR